ncbi:MAG: cupin domain-containing protein [Thermodesulfovibrio sp.]|nr:cupin domain-containing protein [Thermodesulfovibrio sp.]
MSDTGNAKEYNQELHAMKKKKPTSFCEIPSEENPAAAGVNKDAFYRHKGNFSWTGVTDQPYKTAGTEWSDVIRRVLIGAHGETTRFHVRYFEIAPGGRSSLEQHRHEHVVICVRGEGLMLSGKRRRKLKFMDTAYIAPGSVHRLSNPLEEPFGFLCIVNSRRDRPKIAGTPKS